MTSFGRTPGFTFVLNIQKWRIEVANSFECFNCQVFILLMLMVVLLDFSSKAS